MIQVKVEILLSPTFGKETPLVFFLGCLFFGRQPFYFDGKPDMNLQALLEKSASQHSHLCPRQILGVRMGLCGMKALGFDALPTNKRLLVIAETDGCFVDGLSAATNCTVGHRTLRIEDYGKTATTFVDVKTGRALRLAPVSNIRDLACECVSEESRRYFAQMQAYQTMSDDEMFTVSEVRLLSSIESIVSRPGLRVNCDLCGEEIMNEREVRQNGLVLCRACSGNTYYQPAGKTPILSMRLDGKSLGRA
jgi:formylmethanofuran dehydrogenase subunit E